jgi:hypothetical protein
MFFSSWLRNRTTTPRANRAAALRQRPARFRPALEMLEDRCVPSTLTVTNTLDSGDGSIRADVTAAASGDTIVFNIPKSDPGYNATTGVWTITLTSGELLITKNLTITGPGEANLTISGNHASRVFDLEQTGKNKAHQSIPQVSLSGMTISNGNDPGGPGGAILNNGACTLTITNSILSNNSAGSGGAIYNVGTLTVNGCTLTGNSATAYSGSGGAIENLDGTLTVSPSSVNASLITNNSANHGGGIWNSGTATLTATILSGNSAIATGSAGNGGGIANELSGTLTLNGCTLYGDSADSYGGGIFVGGGGDTINLSGCTLAHNSASWGGGIFLVNYTTATISGCVVGPAIVGGILLQGNSAQQGGGIYVSGGTLTVKNSSTITGNTAPAGQGADVYNLGTVYLDASSIISILDGNHAKPI